jgi:DNA-binding transcriptional MerR regulator
VSERPYLSIGEVLGLLLEEFPDVTISKIRFLESQGLIDPERTASGYRKFYETDVERLRVILREQRENFLPLRVIRDRLENGQIDDSGSISAPRGIRNVTMLDDGFDETGELELPAGTRVPTEHHPAAQSRQAGQGGQGGQGGPPPSAPPAPRPSADAAAFFAGSGEVPPSVLGSTPDGYSANELCIHAGITNKQLSDLESFGLITRPTGPGAAYTPSDLEVAQACKGLLDRGVDARHLRGWRHSAEREANLFEQLVLPLQRQRNPQSHHQAVETLNELSRLGGELRQVMLALALAHLLEN